MACSEPEKFGDWKPQDRWDKEAIHNVIGSTVEDDRWKVDG